MVGSSGSITGLCLSPNGAKMSLKTTTLVCTWMWTKHGRLHHVLVPIPPFVRGHQVRQSLSWCSWLSLITQQSLRLGICCLSFRFGSHWAPTTAWQLSWVEEEKNMDTFQRPLLCLPYLFSGQLGPCVSWMHEDGCVKNIRMISFQ